MILGSQNLLQRLMLVVGLLATMTVASYAAEAAIADKASTGDPQPLLEDRIHELLTRLRNNSEAIRKDKSVAYKISDELIVPLIDFPRITRLVIGKYWRDASDTQREELVKQVRDLLVRSYVTAMSSYIDDLVSEKNMIDFMPSNYRARRPQGLGTRQHRAGRPGPRGSTVPAVLRGSVENLRYPHRRHQPGAHLPHQLRRADQSGRTG